MKLYFTIDDSTAATVISSYLERKNYTREQHHGASPLIVYELDNEDKISKGAIGPVEESFIFHLNDSLTALAFIKVVDGEVLARFNEGKTEYSLIDFNLWKSIFSVEDLNIRHQSIGHMLVELTLEVTRVCHTEVTDIDRIKLLSYKLSAEYGFEDVKTNNVNFLIFEPMAQVLMYGAKKYDRDNWKKSVTSICQIADSLLRHIVALQNEEVTDKESGIHHVGHIMCNVMFLAYHLNK